MKTIVLFIWGLILLVSHSFNPAPTNPKNNRIPHERPYLEDTPHVVRGHVKNTGGNAIVGAIVKLTLAGQSMASYSATTDNSGAYGWTTVAPQTYTMSISANGYVTKSFTLVVNTDIDRTDTLIAN